MGRSNTKGWIPLRASMVGAVALLMGAVGCSGPETSETLVAPSWEKQPVSDTPQARQEHQERMARWAVEHGLSDPPPAKIIRFVHPDDLNQVQVDCLLDHGLDAKLEDGGAAISIEGHADQEQQSLESEYVCSYQYPESPELRQPLNTETIKALYAHHKSFTVPCLAQEGHMVELPSEEKVISDYENTGKEWSPMHGVDPFSANYNQLHKQCQVFPADLIMKHNR